MPIPRPLFLCPKHMASRGSVPFVLAGGRPALAPLPNMPAGGGQSR